MLSAKAYCANGTSQYINDRGCGGPYARRLLALLTFPALFPHCRSAPPHRARIKRTISSSFGGWPVRRMELRNSRAISHTSNTMVASINR